MKKFLFSVILLISACIITKYLILSKFGLILFILTIIDLLFRNGIKKSLTTIGDYFWESAYIQDLGWNVILQTPFNFLFCNFTENYYHFGKPGETISSVVGKNLQIGNTNKLLIGFSKLLDFGLGKNHCIVSIQNDL